MANRIGFLFTEENSKKLEDICMYMQKSPYLVLTDAIERMWDLYMDVTEDAR